MATVYTFENCCYTIIENIFIPLRAVYKPVL